MGDPITNKKQMRFQSEEALRDVERVVNEAAAALNDSSRTISSSSMPEVLAGALGAGAGGAASFAALYGLGVAGLSAAGITSGLAAAGAVIGGGMAAGIAVLAAPAVILGGIGVGIAAHAKTKKLINHKVALYKDAVSKQNAIIKALQQESYSDKKRIDYLNSLNILLQRAVGDLEYDLGIAA